MVGLVGSCCNCDDSWFGYRILDGGVVDCIETAETDEVDRECLRYDKGFDDSLIDCVAFRYGISMSDASDGYGAALERAVLGFLAGKGGGDARGGGDGRATPSISLRSDV